MNLEHLHQALEILDEMEESSPATSSGSKNMHSSRGMEEYNKSSQMVFIGSSIDEIVLIASSRLLLVVSHLFAVSQS
jgi:hypothetical protein